MPRFSANISMLFTEHALLDRIDAAAHSGFAGVEVQFPYEVPAADWKQRLSDVQIPLVLHNLPAGDWAGGDRGIACDPSRQQEFREGIKKALDYATELQVPRLNCLAGRPGVGISDDETSGVFIDNLNAAIEACSAAGVTLLIEPVNTRDVPGFWLHDVPRALFFIEEIGSPHLKLQFDIYHAQRSGGEIAKSIEDHLDQISHIQFADNPGRHEPGTGELNFDFLFQHIDDLGYDGWLGGEYSPSGPTSEGLTYLNAEGRA